MTIPDLADGLACVERILRRVVDRPARDPQERDWRDADLDAALRKVQAMRADVMDEGIEDALCAACRAEEDRALREAAGDARYEASIQEPAMVTGLDDRD